MSKVIYKRPGFSKIEFFWISNQNWFDCQMVKNKLILLKILTGLHLTFITISNGRCERYKTIKPMSTFITINNTRCEKYKVTTVQQGF